jgi:hypothetical protein
MTVKSNIWSPIATPTRGEVYELRKKKSFKKN